MLDPSNGVREEVIGGLIVAVVVTVAGWAWTGRRRPVDWVATGRTAFEAR